MPPPCSCRHPAASLTCSDSPGASEVRNSQRTSQRACARKTRSKAPARNCGRPNRSRVKNRLIMVSRVFYHERAAFKKCQENGRPNSAFSCRPEAGKERRDSPFCTRLCAGKSGKCTHVCSRRAAVVCTNGFFRCRRVKSRVELLVLCGDVLSAAICRGPLGRVA